MILMIVDLCFAHIITRFTLAPLQCMNLSVMVVDSCWFMILMTVDLCFVLIYTRFTLAPLHV
jgi:hypothetical protein